MQSTLGNRKSIKTPHWGELRGYWFYMQAFLSRRCMNKSFLLLSCLVSDDIERVEDIHGVDNLFSLFCAVLLTTEENDKTTFLFWSFFKHSFWRCLCYIMDISFSISFPAQTLAKARSEMSKINGCQAKKKVCCFPPESFGWLLENVQLNQCENGDEHPWKMSAISPWWIFQVVTPSLMFGFHLNPLLGY